MKIVVTGGLGFIGSAFVRYATDQGVNCIVIDNMTYAADMDESDGTSVDHWYFEGHDYETDGYADNDTTSK